MNNIEENKLSTDVYDITSFINSIGKKFNEDLDDETLAMGMYGYLQDIMTRITQNSVTMAAEWGNEAVANRSKFEKTILSNAIAYDVQGINATPSKLHVMIGFLETELIEKMGDKNYIILDKDMPYMIEDNEFHLDYDLYISRTKLENNEYVYSARYILGNPNPISDIVNPYLSLPVKMQISYNDFIFINCVLHQVTMSTQETTLTSDVFIDNKTFEFEFEDQLAYFYVDITEKNKTTTLTPVFNGMPPSMPLYCYYSYLDASNIRVKLDRASYEPRSSAKVNITTYTTLGSKGNFKYVGEDIQLTLKSDKYEYDGLMCLLRTVGDACDGIDRKSVEDLKLLIPKERLSRGTINNNKDLENFFYNMDNTRLYFYKKRTNQFERLYYAFMIMQDENDNIVPTNTLDIDLYDDDVDNILDNRLVINPGKKFIYDEKSERCHIVKDESEITDKSFIYTSPFTIVINTFPYLTMSYYSTNIEKSTHFEYKYINQDCPLQFICDYMKLERHYLKNEDDYVITINLLQNIIEDFGIIEVDKETGKIINTDNVKIMLLIENSDGTKYYVEGTIIEFNPSIFSYKVEFRLYNDSAINKDNMFRVNNIYKANDSVKTYAFIQREVNMSVYVYYKHEDHYYGNNNVTYFRDSVAGYSLSNVFKTKVPVEMYHNYSETVRSTIKMVNIKGEKHYRIMSSPLIRHSYMEDITRNKNVLKYLRLRKVYIDDAVKVMEDSFTVDLKFFNTYGKSKMFIIGHNDELLDRTNLTLNFRVKLKINADENIVKKIRKSIKEYIENINVVRSIHMTNLTTEIQKEYSANIEFIEFVGLNDYDATYQYLEKIDVENRDEIPEFINTNLLNDITTDINIETV